jgi:hypothetical protein
MAIVEPLDHQHSVMYSHLVPSVLEYAAGAVTVAAEAAVDIASVAGVAESLHLCACLKCL